MLFLYRHNALILGIKKPEAASFGQNWNEAIFRESIADIFTIRGVAPAG